MPSTYPQVMTNFTTEKLDQKKNVYFMCNLCPAVDVKNRRQVLGKKDDDNNDSDRRS